MAEDTLVLVPGLNCTQRLYEPQMAALAPICKIIVADHGRDDSMTAIASRVLAAAPDRFALGGLSMGGYVALEIMRQAPGRVTRLALLDTNARADTDEVRENRKSLMALAEDGRFVSVHDALWPKLVHARRQSDSALEQIVREMALETGPQAFVRQQRAIMSRRDSRALLPSIEVPVLVLVGDADQLTPPEQAREMADLLPRASLTVVPGCGHLSTLEQPGHVSRAIEAWLGAAPRGLS